MTVWNYKGSKMNRTTLTKSLHTVTGVSNVALHLLKSAPDTDSRIVTIEALRLLGQWDGASYPETDPTFAACVAKVAKLRAGGK